MTSLDPTAGNPLLIGIDVGSTTVKAVAVDGSTRRIVWSDYQRHETRQAEKVVELVEALEAALPDVPGREARVFLTGSGARPLAEPLGGLFVQEVNAVTLAVEALHPDVGSVIELGGQDAKIIVFKPNPETGEKQPICSMNDKCASGTGATIDKCMIKVGMPEDDVRSLRFDAGRLHKVAAKCGVFAETDIVNLVKTGIPSAEIMCSLADAIVGQNLSVLARGNTLLDRVLLLGGPNTYLPFLQECWRVRIPETWAHRGHEVPDVPIEDLVIVPENAQYYAAYGAVIYGLEEPPHVGRYRGLDGLRALVARGSAGGGQADRGPALVRAPGELEAFRRRYSIPTFQSARFAAGTVVRAAIGLDGGSTSSKAVLVSEDGDVLAKAYRLSKGNPIQDMRELLADLKEQLDRQACRLDVLGFGVTGYAADVIEESVLADVNIVETVAHVMSATHFFDEVDVICDIGGQDIKVLFLRGGDIKDFRLSNQCSAGNGMLLQAMAAQFGVPIEKYAETAFRATLSPTFSYGCAVFLDSDRVNFQKEGYSREELLAGLAMVLPKNVWQYVVQVPRLAELGRRYVLQGGTQYNLAAVKAQVDYIEKRVPGAEVHVHPHCGEAGAIGAAIEALRVVRRRGSSSFVGLERAIGISYSTTNDESTRCHFCPNLCSRTFVDTKTADGKTSRYISGFSCEKGTVESKEAMRELVAHRKELKKSYVNLVEYEARLAFRSFYSPEPLPAAGTSRGGPEDQAAPAGVWSRLRGLARPAFRRSSESAASHRRRLRIGIPRVLNVYSTAPFFRAYLETLGVRSQNIRFSPATTEEMYQEGARYGSVDPCYPSKVAQAHIHHLLFHEHAKKALDVIFFPTLTHVPTFVEGALDSTTCPIVAGTPNVMKAAFTKDVSFFSERGIDYVDGALTLEEPFYLRRQMFEMWGERLGITEDENDFAVDQGFRALSWFDEEMQRRGMELLEKVEAEHRVAILMLGRPYHADPGMHHGVLEEFQALGYPILSIRSIPKDPGWLGRWFREDLERGRISSPLEVGDVWPENYSTNSVQKVWAAKFAARHPNVAILDLSSFKCGHDAPTYGLIDSIVKAGKKPYMALHDLDANKPAGSQMIRVKTYAHTLTRYREKLADRAERWSELERRVAAKRVELLAKRRGALARVAARDRERRRELEEMERAFERYLDEDEAVFGIRLADLEKTFPFAPPDYDASADVAPLGPTEEVLSRSSLHGHSGLVLELPVVGASAGSSGGSCGSGGCGSCGGG